MKALLLLSIVGGVLGQVPSVCPPGWQSNSDRCYNFVFYPPLPYDDAARECQRNGAVLLTVETEQEHNFVISNLNSADVLRQDWYTSAEKDTRERDPHYVWTSTSVVLPLNSPFWVTPQTPFNLDKTMNLVTYSYNFDIDRYGLTLVRDRAEPRPYICEISRNEVYRVNIQNRGFDYGVKYTDLARVPRKSEIISQTGDTTIIGRTTLVYLDCVARGVPLPSFYWTRTVGGTTQRVTSTLDSRYTVTNGRLSIQDPKEHQDAGQYQCVVSNDIGTILGTPSQLDFAALGEFPNIPASPVRPKSLEGAVIECPTLPTKLAQDLRYQWTKCHIDDHECIVGGVRKEFVRPDLNIYVFNSGSGKLYFSEVTTADNGYYYCVATLTNINENDNYEGASQPPSRTSQGILLNVTGSGGGEFAPQIQNGFINVVPGSPLEGKTVRLECFAYGTLPLQYKWTVPSRWDSVRYRLEDSSRILTIEDVRLDDSGTFSCTVVGKGGRRDATQYTLNVESKPRFLLELQDMFLDEGTKQLTWRCEARSIPFPLYTWYKDGEMIQNSSSGDIKVFRNTLHLTNLNQNMEGMYQCAANNTHGVTFSSGQLRILSIKPSFDKYPMERTMTGADGGNITILCRPEAAPFPAISWFHNGGNMNVGYDYTARQHMTLRGDLVMSDLTQADRGLYECRVSNVHGEAKNETMLNLVGRTVIYRGPVPSTVELNRTAFLYCSASYHYSLDLAYQWAFNGRIINLNNHIHFRRGDPPENLGGLYIRSAQFDHTGTYTCIARTQVDSANASATLKVLGPPPEVAGVAAYKRTDATQTIMNTGVALSTRDVVLRWTDPLNTHGAPIDSYMIFGQTNYSVTWHILFTNVPHTETIIPGLPDGQRRQYVIPGLKAGVSYKFKVQAVNMYGVGLFSKPTKCKSWEYVIAELKAGVSYKFKVQAVNMYGVELLSKPTSEIVIPGAAPDVPPMYVGGGGGSVGTLRITWEPLPPEDHNGWGIGYTVEWKLRPAPGEQTSNRGWTTAVVNGNVGEYSTTIGKDNYYLPYNVRVTPFNHFGDGRPGYNDTVYSAEEMPIGIPKNVYAEPFNESALTIHWQPVQDTREAMRGRLKGYKVNYWLKLTETQLDARQYIIYKQTDQATIIGLQPDTWYTVTVIAFNNAGNSLKSEVAHQQTDRSAPLNYPINIYVYPHTTDSVMVTFRGVSTGVWEEPLLGYKIRYWRDSDDIRNAQDINCEKRTYGHIYQLQQNTLYHLRVLGYSMGGDGKMSSPQTLFSLMKERVAQINWDPSTTKIVTVYNDYNYNMAARLSSSITLVLLGVTLLITRWIVGK